MAQLTAHQLGACTMSAHLLWICLFDTDKLAVVRRQLSGEKCTSGTGSDRNHSIDRMVLLSINLSHPSI